MYKMLHGGKTSYADILLCMSIGLADSFNFSLCLGCLDFPLKYFIRALLIIFSVCFPFFMRHIAGFVSCKNMRMDSIRTYKKILEKI